MGIGVGLVGGKGFLKTGDEVVDAGLDALSKKRNILKRNKILGKLAEVTAKDDLINAGYTALGSQVSVRTPKGVRIIDHLVQDAAGNLKAIEVKAGNAVRKASQKAKYDIISHGGGVIFGKNAENVPANLRTGEKIDVEVMRYYESSLRKNKLQSSLYITIKPLCYRTVRDSFPSHGSPCTTAL